MLKKKSGILLTIVLVIIFIASLSFNDSISDLEGRIEYTVQNGDTAWDIVKSHYGEKYPYEEACYYMKKDNGLDSVGNLYPGQVLILRVAASK